MEAKPPAPELKSPLVPLDSAAAVDETAQIETTLTEGLRTLRIHGVQLDEFTGTDPVFERHDVMKDAALEGQA